jgi:murein DD-endopeptidase MepM/ murein hydrolase activator NlpD
MKKKIILNRFRLLLILLIATIFTSCIQSSPSPQQLNVFDYTSFRIAIEKNTSTVNLHTEEMNLTLDNATTSETYMFIRNLLSQFEEAVYTYKNSNPKAATETVPLNDTSTVENLPRLQMLSTESLPINNLITFSLIAQEEASNEKKYILNLDTENQLLFLQDGDYIFTYSPDIFSSFVESSLLIPKEDLALLPRLHIQSDTITLTSEEEINWNKHVISDRFLTTERTTSTLSDSDTHIFKEPSTLTLFWPESFELPNACQIQFISQTKEATTPVSSPLEFTPMESGMSSISFDLPSDPDTYLVEITSSWLPIENLDYGTIINRFLLVLDYPVTFTLKNTLIEPGDLVVIQGHNLHRTEDYVIQTNLVNTAPEFIESNSQHFLFIPLMSKYKPGLYSLSIMQKDTNEILAQFEVTVSEKEFSIQHLKTSTATASLQNTANNDQLTEAFNRARANPYPEKLWTGPFIQPCGGRISTEYGVIRYTNGEETGSRHSGIDFAIAEGTPVVASQSGYVRLAEYLNITGNTILIDHGLGFYTHYYHLFSMDVNVNDFVDAGTLIGTVGTTGFSTGPHLHFSVYYRGIYLNPWKFFENAPF